MLRRLTAGCAMCEGRVPLRQPPLPRARAWEQGPGRQPSSANIPEADTRSIEAASAREAEKPMEKGPHGLIMDRSGCCGHSETLRTYGKKERKIARVETHARKRSRTSPDAN